MCLRDCAICFVIVSSACATLPRATGSCAQICAPKLAGAGGGCCWCTRFWHVTMGIPRETRKHSSPLQIMRRRQLRRFYLSPFTKDNRGLTSQRRLKPFFGAETGHPSTKMMEEESATTSATGVERQHLAGRLRDGDGRFCNPGQIREPQHPSQD